MGLDQRTLGQALRCEQKDGVDQRPRFGLLDLLRQTLREEQLVDHRIVNRPKLDIGNVIQDEPAKEDRVVVSGAEDTSS